MKNNECNVIKDLIPNYIERLTSAETTQYIENHLSTCNECKKVFENMNSDISKNDNSDIKRDIKFAKKYNKKFIFFKVTLLIIITIFLISTIRNGLIILSLEKKAEIYNQKSNYYLKCFDYNLNTIRIIENYNKDGKSLQYLKVISKSDLTSVSEIIESFDNTNEITYIKNQTGEKKAFVSEISGGVIPSMMWNSSYYSSNFNFFIFDCIFGGLKTVKCNGKECYLLRRDYNFLSPTSFYINKETGLPVRILDSISGASTIEGTYEEYNCLQDFYYEWNTVTDEDITPPNINEYIIENSKDHF